MPDFQAALSFQGTKSTSASSSMSTTPTSSSNNLSISRSSSSDESSSPTPGVRSPRDIYKIVEENETDDDKHFDADDENTTDDESLSQLSNDSWINKCIIDVEKINMKFMSWQFIPVE